MRGDVETVLCSRESWDPRQGSSNNRHRLDELLVECPEDKVCEDGTDLVVTDTTVERLLGKRGTLDEGMAEDTDGETGSTKCLSVGANIGEVNEIFVGMTEDVALGCGIGKTRLEAE